MLILVFEGIHVPRQALRPLFGCDRTFRNSIEVALRKEHMREEKFSFSSRKSTRTIYALTVTPAGLEYINRHCPEYFQKVRDVDLTALIPGRENGGLNIADKIMCIRSSLAGIFSFLAGAYVAFPLNGRESFQYFINGILEDKYRVEYEQRETEPNSYAAMLDYMARKSGGYGGGDMAGRQNLNGTIFSFDSPEQIFFISRSTMRRTLASIHGSAGMYYDPKDFDRCRYNGILVSRFKTVSIYVNVSANVGMPWNEALLRQDTVAVHNLQNCYTPDYSAGQDTNRAYGFLLTDNPKHLASLLFDHAGTRKPPRTKRGEDRKNPEEIGRGFDSLFAIPTTRRGADLLRRIMLRDEAEFENGFITRCLETDGDLTLNTGSAAKLFPLARQIQGKTLYLAPLLTMDLVRMQKIIKAAPSLDGYIGVYCEPWERPYVEAVFREAGVTVFVQDMEDTDINLPDGFALLERQTEKRTGQRKTEPGTEVME